MIIWAYAVARLLQVPVEYHGTSPNARAWLVITSIIGIVLVTWAYSDVVSAAKTVTNVTQ
jgi:hypothetical protein